MGADPRLKAAMAAAAQHTRTQHPLRLENAIHTTMGHTASRSNLSAEEERVLLQTLHTCTARDCAVNAPHCTYTSMRGAIPTYHSAAT